jgi:hypothetical protein
MKLAWRSIICWIIRIGKLNLNRRITTKEKIIYNISAYILNRLSFNFPFQITCNGVTWNYSIGYKTMGPILKLSFNNWRHTWCCLEINAVLFMFSFLNNWILQMNHSKCVQDVIRLACDRSRHVLKYCRTVSTFTWARNIVLELLFEQIKTFWNISSLLSTSTTFKSA